MRLRQIDHKVTLSEQLKMEETHTMSNSETKLSIDNWYQAALLTDNTPYWIQNGYITNWNASMADWYNSISVPRLQMLDEKWKSYVRTLHYTQYLYSKEAHLQLQQAELDQQRAKIKDEIAKALVHADGQISSDSRNSKTD